MPALPDFVTALPHGIFAIDTGFHRPRFDASYLMLENGRGAFVDTGTNHSVPRLLDALAAVGLAPDAVDLVIATHVHLDHAGGVGLLMKHLPRAMLVVHPRGARHLIDPRALVAGARAVYGDEEMQRSYGDILAVPAERVLQTEDGLRLPLAGRELLFLDTPGHARHHHCIWDERSRGFFTGDTFGLSYREFDTENGAWLLPTTTPVQFEPEALRASVERLLGFDPQCMYLTHFGRVEAVQRLGADFLDQLDAMVALGRRVDAEAMNPAERHNALKRGLATLYGQRLDRHGVTMARDEALGLLEMDLELNAQGMGVWLDKTTGKAPHERQPHP